MQAIRVHAPGGPEAMRLDELSTPGPAAGEALVRVEAAGVNFIDVYQRNGLYKVPLPAVLGQEGAGTVEQVGAGVTGIAPGERVAWASVLGAYATHALVPAHRLVKLPAGVSAAQAAAAMLQGMTAHYLARGAFALAPGSTCLVHAAAGGVGLWLVQVAELCGARVIGTVSTDAKAVLARRAGADDVIVGEGPDVTAEVRRLTGGRGVDVVYDGVGAATFDVSLSSLRPRGMLVSFGNASGPVPPVSPLLLSQHGSLFLTRPKLADYIESREELELRAGEVLEWVRSGMVMLHIHREYPLAAAADAHRDLESRATAGKLLLIPG